MHSGRDKNKFSFSGIFIDDIFLYFKSYINILNK